MIEEEEEEEIYSAQIVTNTSTRDNITSSTMVNY